MKEQWKKLLAAFEDLSQRERLLVLAAAGVLLVGLVYVAVVMPALSAGRRAEDRVAAAEQQLAAMVRLREEFDDVNVRLTSVEERIRNGPSGNVRTTLESLAERALVSKQVESMEPQASPANELYRENKVEVALEGVTLSQTVNYLHQIEESQQVLSVKSLRIRRRPDGELLDVTFSVSSFEPL